jgi:hypothetical protein
MKLKFAAATVSAFMALSFAAPAMASTPRGQRGYEGQPGHQGGYHHAGQNGYEGQPGNQSGKGGR